MLDPAILTALELPLPPAPPLAAEERVWLSPGGEKAQRHADRNAAAYEGYVRPWLAKLEALRTIAAAMPTVPFTDEERAKVDQLIEDVEAHAELRATASARFAKRVARDVKRDFARDPSVGAARRAFGEKLLRLDQEVIEAMLEYALFLRAFRAERIPEARGGQTFTNAAELSHYLDTALA